jgi:hypothetical protein
MTQIDLPLQSRENDPDRFACRQKNSDSRCNGLARFCGI